MTNSRAGRRVPLIALFAFVASVALAPSTAHAYSLTCYDAGQAVTSGDPQLQGVVVGHALGVLDFTAALICLGHLPQCNCLQNLALERPEDFGREIGTRLAQCYQNTPNAPAFGPAFNAVQSFCPF